MKLLSAFAFCLTACAQYRVVYPYSVIPGGLSQISLEQVEDPVARRAWDGVKTLSPACLRAGMYYLQYRRNADVGWAQQPRQIAAGEPVFVDQDGHILRSRCGNGVSSTAQLPLVPFVPPSAAEEETIFVEWVEPPGMPPTVPLIANLISELPPLPPFEERPPAVTPTSELPSSLPPQVSRFVYVPLPSNAAPWRIMPIPEPKMMFLVGGGLVLIVLAAHLAGSTSRR